MVVIKMKFIRNVNLYINFLQVVIVGRLVYLIFFIIIQVLKEVKVNFVFKFRFIGQVELIFIIFGRGGGWVSYSGDCQCLGILDIYVSLL